MIMTLALMVYFRLVWGNAPAFGPYLLVGFFLLRALPRVAGCGQQVIEDGLADHADQAIAGGDDDSLGGDDLIGSGFGTGVDRVHGDPDDRLVDGEQGVDLLVDVGRVLGAQDPPVEDRGLDRQIGGFFAQTRRYPQCSNRARASTK